MSKKLQIGNKFIDYPSDGQEAGWGFDATKFAELVAEALQTVQGPNDILPTSVSLVNNQTSAANIPGLLFNVSEVLFTSVECLVERVYDSGATKVSESFVIVGNFNGTNFNISVERTGDDTGINIDALDSGQFTYTSTDLPNHVSTTIRYQAKTIDQP